MGPYAYRTKLGWYIVGAIVNKSSNKSVKYNCTVSLTHVGIQ